MSRPAWKGKVLPAVESAVGIAFDGCHKIYILLDEEAYATQASYGYGDGTDESMLIRLDDPSVRKVAYGMVRDWYRSSCMLRFINTVRTDHDDENAGYTAIVPQGSGG